MEHNDNVDGTLQFMQLAKWYHSFFLLEVCVHD